MCAGAVGVIQPALDPADETVIKHDVKFPQMVNVLFFSLSDGPNQKCVDVPLPERTAEQTLPG